MEYMREDVTPVDQTFPVLIIEGEQGMLDCEGFSDFDEDELYADLRFGGFL